MQCVSVLPILKRTFADTLMYWTVESCQPGDVIQIKIQNRNVWAVVESIASIHQAKEYIKAQTFTIRKIDKIVRSNAFSREFILSVLDTSRYYVRDFGEVFSELIPKKILENLEEYEIAEQIPQEKTNKTTEYIQFPLTKRLEKLQEYITETTCIISPTKNHATHLKQKGFVNVHLPIDLYLLDSKYNSCILELASSEYYRHLRKDFDYRFFIRNFCKRKGIQLIESDTLLPVYIENIPTKNLDYKVSKDPQLHLIDLSESGKAKAKAQDKTPRKLQLISPELLSMIKHCEKNEESILLYTVRKGFSQQIVCSDCKHVLSCATCNKPLHVQTIGDQKVYACDTCNTTQTTNMSCPICTNWNLAPLGASTAAVKEELQQVTDMDIVIIDSDHQTKSSAKKKLKNKEKGTIYIGTELLLTQSYETAFDYAAVVSLESLLAIPSRTAELDAARVVYTLAERTQKDLLIQTRNKKNILWEALEAKDWKILLDKVKSDLEMLKMPPYRTHVQIEAKRPQDAKQINDYLKTQTEIQKTNTNQKEIIHLFFDSKSWPDQYIYNYLKTLPSSVNIQVDRTNFM